MQTNTSKSTGCSNTIVLLGVFIWILTLTGLSQFAFWVIDEIIFEGGSESINISKAIIRLFFSGGILVAILPLSRSKRFIKPLPFINSWKYAAFYPLLFIPLAFLDLTGSVLANILQILGSLLFISVIFLMNGRDKRKLSFKRGSSDWSLPLIIGAFLAAPWAAWGALGSPLDSLLGLISGLLFGVSAGITLEPLRKELITGQGRSFGRFFISGLASSVTLVMMATGYGFSNEKWVLVLCLSGVGWIIAGINFIEGKINLRSRSIPLALLPGVAASLPKIFLDPDELFIGLSSGQGELLEWTLRISLTHFVLCILISLFLFSISNVERVQIRPSLIGIGVFLAWAIPAGIFVLAGQKGFNGERLFVVLKGTADLTSASTIDDIKERRNYVFQTLTTYAEQSQQSLISELGKKGIKYKTYYLINGIEVIGGPLLRIWLNNRNDVDRVLNNPILRPLPEPIPINQGNQSAPQDMVWNLSYIGADRVWNEFGVTGAGITIGQSDSGVQGDHPELLDAYRGARGSDDYNWFDPWNHTTQPVDIGGHGTHTLGSVLGKSTGVAPGALWFGCVNLARNLGNPAVYLDCMQFMLAPFPKGGDPFHDGNPGLSADILNNSWGCPEVEGCDALVLKGAVEALRSAGIFVVASAGNSGMFGCGSVTDPIAIYDSVYSVGAITSSGALEFFSSLGPVEVDGSDRVKPDIVAPGVDIFSSFPGSSYSTQSGTSMAGPHVVGVVALMWSANPGLIGKIDETEAILNQTAQPYSGILPDCVDVQQIPNNGVGWGVVNAYSAVKQAMEW